MNRISTLFFLQLAATLGCTSVNNVIGSPSKDKDSEEAGDSETHSGSIRDTTSPSTETRDTGTGDGKDDTGKSKRVVFSPHKIYVRLLYNFYHMLNLLIFPLLMRMSKTVFVPIRAVKRFIETPRLNVIANPFMGPVPN